MYIQLHMRLKWHIPLQEDEIMMHNVPNKRGLEKSYTSEFCFYGSINTKVQQNSNSSIKKKKSVYYDIQSDIHQTFTRCSQGRVTIPPP